MSKELLLVISSVLLLCQSFMLMVMALRLLTLTSDLRQTWTEISMLLPRGPVKNTPVDGVTRSIESS